MHTSVNANKYLKIALKKHALEKDFEFFSTLWANNEPASARSLKKYFISSMLNVDYRNINLYVENWREDIQLPNDVAFADIYRALVADHNNSCRSKSA
jgi:hypothetical protein